VRVAKVVACGKIECYQVFLSAEACLHASKEKDAEGLGLRAS
jgi:hypothetical protein